MLTFFAAGSYVLDFHNLFLFCCQFFLNQLLTLKNFFKLSKREVNRSWSGNTQIGEWFNRTNKQWFGKKIIFNTLKNSYLSTKDLATHKKAHHIRKLKLEVKMPSVEGRQLDMGKVNNSSNKLNSTISLSLMQLQRFFLQSEEEKI